MGILNTLLDIFEFRKVAFDQNIGRAPQDWGRSALFDKVQETMTEINKAASAGHLEKLSFELASLAALAEFDDKRVDASLICAQLNELVRNQNLGLPFAVDDSERKRALALIGEALNCANALRPRILARQHIAPQTPHAGVDEEAASAGSDDRQSSPIISAKDLTIVRGGNSVLRGVNLSIYPREIVLIVGRNGSGKSTLLKALAGELRPEQGSVTYPALAEEFTMPQQILNEVRLIEQHTSVPRLPLRTSLRLFAALHGIKQTSDNESQVEDTIGHMSLDAYPELSAEKLSTGYKTRFEIAKAMIKDPRVLLLDEPLAPLDAAGKRLYLRALRDLAESPKWEVTIVVAAQETTDLEQIADRVIVVGNSGAAPLEHLLPDEGCAYEIRIAGEASEIPHALGQMAGAEFSVDLHAIPIRITSPKVISPSAVLDTLRGLDVLYFRDVSSSAVRVLGGQR